METRKFETMEFILGVFVGVIFMVIMINVCPLYTSVTPYIEDGLYTKELVIDTIYTNDNVIGYKIRKNNE